MGCTIDTVRVIGPHQTLKRCRVHGIAFVEDTTVGQAHSAHANISTSGNPSAVYGKDARIVRCRGWAYNTSSYIVSDTLDDIARQECRCGGAHGSAPSASLDRGHVISVMDAAIRVHRQAFSNAKDRAAETHAQGAESAVRELRAELLGSRWTEFESGRYLRAND